MSGTAVVASLAASSWELSGLVRMSSTEPMAHLARTADSSFALVPSSSHYDGVYYYAIARDPLAQGEAHRLIDKAAYRYGHAGFGWLAWALSLGRASAVPAAMLALGLAGMVVAALAVSGISVELGRSPWWGLVVALSPGLVFAVTVSTAEPVGAAALTVGLLAWMRGRTGWSVPFLVAACLIKEPYVLVPAALALWELIRLVREHRPFKSARRVAVLAAGPAALAVWYGYLRLHLGVWPSSESANLLSFPLTGWVDSVRQAAHLVGGSYDQMQIGGAMVPVLVALAAALVVGATKAARLRSPLDVAFLLFLALVSTYNWLTILYPKDLIRDVAILALLLPAAIGGPLHDDDATGVCKSVQPESNR